MEFTWIQYRLALKKKLKQAKKKMLAAVIKFKKILIKKRRIEKELVKVFFKLIHPSSFNMIIILKI